LRRGRSEREYAHELVADRLDHAPAVLGGHFAHDVQAQADAFERPRVAEFFVQARAAADVGEQDGKIDWCVFQRATETVIRPRV